MEKTNAIRLLEQKKVVFKSYIYDCPTALSGVEMAALLGVNPEKTFKTLVTVGASKKNYVFIVPVKAELDLKKAAKAAGEKSIDMIKSKELLPLTGYIHGGCSPIGMKKFFTTFADNSFLQCDTVIFSGGKIGCQVEMPPSELKKLVPYRTADICIDDI